MAGLLSSNKETSNDVTDLNVNDSNNINVNVSNAFIKIYCFRIAEMQKLYFSSNIISSQNQLTAMTSCGSFWILQNTATSLTTLVKFLLHRVTFVTFITNCDRWYKAGLWFYKVGPLLAQSQPDSLKQENDCKTKPTVM